MVKVNLNTAELTELYAMENPKQKARSTFPIFAPHGAQETAAVYFELNPGDELGTHTDSLEEQLYIIEGSVEATVGEEKENASAGDLLLVPKLVPHNFKNTGTGKAKVLGFFGGGNNITAVFENTWLPLGLKTVSTEMLAEQMG
ncbi:MAG: cupin domain-containing protein [Ignavibacteriaceae bacterium]